MVVIVVVAAAAAHDLIFFLHKSTGAHTHQSRYRLHRGRENPSFQKFGESFTLSIQVSPDLCYLFVFLFLLLHFNTVAIKTAGEHRSKYERGFWRVVSGDH